MTHTSSGEEQSSGRKSQDGSNRQAVIEQRDRDREPHPDRVDGPGTFEEQALIVLEAPSADEAAQALSAAVGDDHAEAETP